MTHDYKRHGTNTLFAGQEFNRFLNTDARIAVWILPVYSTRSSEMSPTCFIVLL